MKKQRLIDAHGSYRLDADDYTGCAISFNDGIITVTNDDGCYICEFDAKKLPTVDAVEVVRCKDCKYYELATPFDGRQKMRCENKKGIWTATQPDVFCSYGERKDNG